VDDVIVDAVAIGCDEAAGGVNVGVFVLILST
jgi:hypothetical protein